MHHRRSMFILVAGSAALPPALWSHSEIVVHEASLGATGIQTGWGAFGDVQPHGDMTPIVSDAPPFTTLSSIDTPDGSFLMSPTHEVRNVGEGWGSWSHGGPITGEIVWTQGATKATYTLPASTGSFDTYVEPGPFQMFEFEVTATALDGSEFTAILPAHGMSGAAHIGFWTTDGAALNTIHIETIDFAAHFAIGEFRYGLLQLPTTGDLDGDDIVGPADLARLLGVWGPCPAIPECPADLSGDGDIGPADLAILLGHWS